MKKNSLRLRTLLITGLTILGLCMVFYQISSWVLLESFNRLEEKQMRNTLSRVRATLDDQVIRLRNWTQDYAWWGETYAFMQHPNQEYKQAYLTPLNLENLDLDLIILLDTDERVVFAGALEPKARELSPIPASSLEQISNYVRLQPLSGTKDTVSGFIRFEGAPMILAAAPILDDDRKGPSRGILIMGQRLPGKALKQLQTLVRLPLSLLPVSEPAAFGLSSRNPEMVQISDGQPLQGLSMIEDLNGAAVAVLKVAEERWIYKQGLKSQDYLLINLICMGLICAAILLGLLERLVLGRLKRFDESMAIISNTQDATLRLPVEGSDELDRLAGTINRMLDSLKKTHAQLLHDALHDQLTGLANRVLFIDRLQNAIHQSFRHPQEVFAILLLDLDGFKYINDSLGHSAGDQVLINAAGRMGYCVRSGDTVARLGGDEFAIMMSFMHDDTDALRLAERLLQELYKPIQWEGHALQVSASIGVAIYTVAYKTAEQMLMDADIAMYRAKNNGKNCYELFNHAMHLQAQARIELENDLRLAIQRNELRVHYQPIVDLQTGSIVSFEALARWQHPRRGWISPQDFIPIAEEIGLAAAIDRWVLAEACSCLKEWRESFVKTPPSVSVNLSCKHFQAVNFVSHVQDTLACNGLNSRDLDLEITESAFGPNKDRSHRILGELAAHGVQLLLDDFGTGYSSLSRLHELPVHILKIDRSFMAHLVGVNATVVGTIITLAHNMGKQVVAEGIETQEQMKKLASLGCEYGQGYYFSRPIPAEEVSSLLREQAPWITTDFPLHSTLTNESFVGTPSDLEKGKYSH